jgi:hypothetical protein
LRLESELLLLEYLRLLWLCLSLSLLRSGDLFRLLGDRDRLWRLGDRDLLLRWGGDLDRRGGDLRGDLDLKSLNGLSLSSLT